jgi:hypothetical protein
MMIRQSPNQPVQPLRVLVPILALLAILLILTRHIGKGEFNYNDDETQHAFTGVFFADLIRDHPISNPVEYAYLYYAQYPALSGLIHWPPFFYLCEGVVFLLLGPSVITARLVILLFALVGLWFWFRLIEELHSTSTAVVAAVVLAFTPSVLLFEKTVMLEIPSLAMCIVASYFWLCFLRKKRNSSLIWFGLTGALAMLTKQNSVYLLLFCFLTISALRKWQLLWHRATLGALAIGLSLAGPYYYLLYKLHWSTIAGSVMEEQTTGLHSLIYYWQAIPLLTGWPLLVLAVMGLFIYLWSNRRENNFVFLSWIFAVWATMTIFGFKEPRYVIYLLPAVVYFAIWPLVTPTSERVWLRISSVGALAGVVAYLAWSAWWYERPYVTGFAPVAHQIRQLTDSGVILVDSDLPGNLVFFMRLEDRARRFVVLRKSLYVTRITESWGGEEFIHTREGVKKLLSDDGIRFIVVSNRPPAHFPIEVTLREMLEPPQFRLVSRYPVEGNSLRWKDYYLLLYENLQARPPAALTLRIPMLTMDHDIEVPFQKLGIAHSELPLNPDPACHPAQ